MPLTPVNWPRTGRLFLECLVGEPVSALAWSALLHRVGAAVTAIEAKYPDTVVFTRTTRDSEGERLELSFEPFTRSGYDRKEGENGEA